MVRRIPPTSRAGSVAAAGAATRADLARVAAAGVCWGTGGVTAVLLIGATGLTPLAVACYRMLAGGLLLTALLAATPALRGVRRDGAALRRMGAIGLLAALYQYCYFAAVSLTSVSLATLVTLGSVPVLVVCADAVLSRRPPAAPLLTGLALALTGLGLLVGSPGAGRNPVLGSLLAVTAAAGFAVITLLSRRRPVTGLDPAACIAGAFTAGGLLLALIATPGELGFALSPVTLLLVVYLGLVPTALAYVLYFGGLRTVAAGPAALIALLEPLTATALGVLLLGERLGAAGIAGGLLLAAAVVYVQRAGGQPSIPSTDCSGPAAK